MSISSSVIAESCKEDRRRFSVTFIILSCYAETESKIWPGATILRVSGRPELEICWLFNHDYLQSRWKKPQIFWVAAYWCGTESFKVKKNTPPPRKKKKDEEENKN